MEYRHDATKIQLINYHIVFCPRYRRRLLVGAIRERLNCSIHQVAEDNNWEILGLEIMPDHVHLFVSADAVTSPAVVVTRFKGGSSYTLRHESPDLSWMKSLWTRSYFISTAGKVPSETIIRYIEDQWNR